MSKTLVVTTTQISHMKEHIRKNRPKEACGIIIGIIDKSQELFTATEIFPTENIVKSNVEFEIDPYELYKIYLHADEIGMEVIGIFHSHPSGTTPSPIDMTFMKANPYIWLIFDMQTLKYDAYFLNIYKNELIKVKVELKT